MFNETAQDVWGFLLLPAARQLWMLPVITVFGGGLFVLLTPFPSSFVCDNKNIPNSLENFLCSDLKRLCSVPRELSGSWIKLRGKILYLSLCCCCGRCWISFYWLVNLSFCGSCVPNPLNFLPRVGFFWAPVTERSRPLLLLSSQFRSPKL